MKAKVETQDLKRALANVGNAISGMRSIPIIGSVRIESVDKKLILSATNLDIMITDKVPAQVQEEGVLILSHRLLNNFVNRATSTEVSFGEVHDKPAVKHGDNVGKFESLPEGEWPGRLNPTQNTITCDAKDFATPIRKVEHAMYNETARQELRGVAVQRIGKKTDFVASDGRRLAVFRSKLDWPEDTKVIIPDVTVKVIVKLIQEGEVTLRLDQQSLVIANGELKIDSRLIEAKYPDYTQLLPKPSEKAFNAERNDLINAARTASLFLDRDQTQVKLTGQKNKLRVSCTDKFKTELLGPELNGQTPDPVSLNGHFLVAALEVLEKDQVRIEFEGGATPLVFREGGLIEMIMPCIEQ